MKGWCPMNHSNAFSHLTLEERRIILTGISNGSTKSAIAKTIGTDTGMQCAVDGVQVMGGYGYMKDYPMEKLMRDAKILQIYEGTNQVQRVVIAGQLLR